MKLNRAQELALIELGFQQLLNGLNQQNGQVRVHKAPWNKGIKTGKRSKVRKTNRKWSAKQRAKFSKTMKAKWAARQAKESQ